MTQKTYIPPDWKICHKSAGGRKVILDKSLDEDRLIYHFLCLPYALEVFRFNRLLLRPVMAWTDPYENAWCELLFEGPDKLNGVTAYGHCWTKSSFDEPLWRMAAFKKTSPIIRISCRVKALIEAGRNLLVDDVGSLYIGNVDYWSEKHLYPLAKSVLKREHRDISSTAAGLLLQKRNAFRFEDEIRLLWLDRLAKRDSVSVPFNANDSIEQVMMSPHTSSEEREAIRNSFKPFGVKPLVSKILFKPKFPS